MSPVATRIAGVMVVAALIAGCGSASDTVRAQATGPGSPGSALLPAGFGTRPSAANEDWLVGVVDEPYRSTKRSTVAEMDLATNETKTFPGPASAGRPVAIEGLVADGDEFVGVGNRCDPPDGGQGCGGPNMLVHLDPAAAAWQAEKIPVDSDGLLDSLHMVGSGLVLVETTNQTLRVTRRSVSGKWSTVATLPTSNRPSSCVAGGDLWLFGRDGGTSPDVTATDTTYWLTRVDLANGRSTQTDLPQLAQYFGGVTTSFGCDVSAPVIATTPAGKVPSQRVNSAEMKQALTGVQVWQRGADSWRRRDVGALGSGSVADSIVSGDRALILAAELTEHGPNRPVAVLLGGNHDQEVPRDGTDTYLWRNKQELLRIHDEGMGRQVERIKVGS